MVVVVVVVMILYFLFTLDSASEQVVETTPTPQPIISSALSIEQLIRSTALKWEADADRMVATAKCESGLKPDAIGDDGASIGLFQIHLPSHPDVTKEEALDPYFAVEWSAKKFKINPFIWVCYIKLYGRPTQTISQ
ncbi:MAG: hypothetical protein WD883_00060 [Candidatus Colwellbacteria bacterium]